MLIEYSINFEGSGIRISQRVTPDGDAQPLASTGNRPTPNESLVGNVRPHRPALPAGDAEEKHLGKAFPAGDELAARAHAGAGDPPPTKVGGGDPPPTKVGGGDPPPTKVGGGLASVSTLVICFGPVVVNASRSAADGGGDPPPTKVGG